ncbi:MAG: hypothetical protein DRO36_00320 [Candidatus Hecatellales archaeon]|nr:MAG: hypothetical protein DRO36_00320 [Candidatus Hecatellales archaeon]
MSTQVSREEAAIISAAVLAYIAKPVSFPRVKVSREDIQDILEEFGRELTEKILREFKDSLGRLERRISVLERNLASFRNRLTEVEKAFLGKGGLRVEAGGGFGFLWGLASRHEVGSQREFIKNLQKPSSFWGLVSKVEKQLSPPNTRKKRTVLAGG